MSYVGAVAAGRQAADAERRGNMAKRNETVLTRHPDPAKRGMRVNRARYAAMRDALLAVVPADDAGVAYRELKARVAPHLPAEAFAGASIAWHVEAVKQDLLARGLVEIVPGARPQRLRARTPRPQERP